MKNEMIMNSIAHNKYLTREYLENKPFNILLAFTHPIDRIGFIKRHNRGEKF